MAGSGRARQAGLTELLRRALRRLCRKDRPTDCFFRGKMSPEFRLQSVKDGARIGLVCQLAFHVPDYLATDPFFVRLACILVQANRQVGRPRGVASRASSRPWWNSRLCRSTLARRRTTRRCLSPPCPCSPYSSSARERNVANFSGRIIFEFQRKISNTPERTGALEWHSGGLRRQLGKDAGLGMPASQSRRCPCLEAVSKGG